MNIGYLISLALSHIMTLTSIPSKKQKKKDFNIY